MRSLPHFDGLSPQESGRAHRAMLMRLLIMRCRGLRYSALLRQRGGALFVGRGARVKNASQITARGRLVIEDFADIQAVSTQGLTFGDSVSIGRGALIRPSSYYGGPVGWGLVMGDRSSIGPHCYIGCSGEVRIGDDVMLGPNVHIASENHVFDSVETTIRSQGVNRTTTVIEDDCWIGTGSVINAGVTIGQGCVIGSGSVVTHDIPPYSVAAGVPARVIRSRHAQP